LKSSYHKIEKHIESEKQRVSAARLSKDPARAKLELGLNTIAERAKKEELNG